MPNEEQLEKRMEDLKEELLRAIATLTNQVTDLAREVKGANEQMQIYRLDLARYEGKIKDVESLEKDVEKLKEKTIVLETRFGVLQKWTWFLGSTSAGLVIKYLFDIITKKGA